MDGAGTVLSGVVVLFQSLLTFPVFESFFKVDITRAPVLRDRLLSFRSTHGSSLQPWSCVRMSVTPSISSGMNSDAICYLYSWKTWVHRRSSVGYPSNKAVSHILRQLLLLLSSLRKMLQGGRKAEIRHFCTVAPPTKALQRPTQSHKLSIIYICLLHFLSDMQ